MLYVRPKFTCPAAGQKTSEKNWDRAFLTADQFADKYGKDELNAAQVPDENLT